ncbi:MAG: hypothetical protein CMF51_04475 [Legionellales bacterium]|nr:hypothetical protein [Legionellales bacterium]
MLNYPENSKFLIFITGQADDAMQLVKNALESALNTQEDIDSFFSKEEGSLSKQIYDAITGSSINKMLIGLSRLEFDVYEFAQAQIDNAKRLVEYLKDHPEQAVFLDSSNLGSIDLIASQGHISDMIEMGQLAALQDIVASTDREEAPADLTQVDADRPIWVLGSGGSKGALQAGWLKIMKDRVERGEALNPSEIHGCSTGALNGALFSANVHPDETIELLKSNALNLLSSTNPEGNRAIFTTKIQGLINASILMYLNPDYRDRETLIQAILNDQINSESMDMGVTGTICAMPWGGIEALQTHSASQSTGLDQLRAMSLDAQDVRALASILCHKMPCVTFSELQSLQHESPDSFSKFATIAVDPQGQNIIYSAETTPHESIADAVMDSACIPFFAQPRSPEKSVDALKYHTLQMDFMDYSWVVAQPVQPQKNEERYDGGFQEPMPIAIREMQLSNAAAATKIQSFFRRFQERMRSYSRESDAASSPSSPVLDEPRLMRASVAATPDIKPIPMASSDLNAATTIQSCFRGFLARKEATWVLVDPESAVDPPSVVAHSA